MPTVVVARCFIDGEHTTDEVEVCLVRRRVRELYSDLASLFPSLSRRHPRPDGSPSFLGIGLVREGEDETLTENDVTGSADRLYLIPTIGC